MVCFEYGRVLQFVLFSGLELLTVAGDEVRMHLFELATNDDFLNGSHHAVEVIIVGVGMGYAKPAAYCFRIARSRSGLGHQTPVHAVPT